MIIAEENLIIEVLKNYIEQDSLYLTQNISPRLLHYNYYPTRYTEDSLQIPSPSITYDGEYLDENTLVERIGNPTYFSSIDAAHIRHQLIRSTDIVKSMNAYDLSEVELDPLIVEKLYVFYVPIFNIDSTAVYVQYDFHDNSFGYGNGALMIKKGGKWQIKDWFPNWIT